MHRSTTPFWKWVLTPQDDKQGLPLDCDRLLELVVCEPAIVRMVVQDMYPMGLCESFKGVLGFDRFFGVRGFLQVYVT